MELTSCFNDFLAEIRLTPNQVQDCIKGHTLLRERLEADESLAPAIVSTFLQGSYRRATAVRPHEGHRADVDVIVVTRLSQEEYPNPQDALNLFVPFLDKHYEGKWEAQGRSFGIHLSYVDLDLVLTSAPSESQLGILGGETAKSLDTVEEAPDLRLIKSWLPSHYRNSGNAWLIEKAASEAEWKEQPLYIPDREAHCWQPTHPLEQIRWTAEKNGQCNGHYVNVVKAIKWWRRLNPTPKYPKGYPVEHLVGANCPDGIGSVAEGVTTSLENIAQNYLWYARHMVTPFLPDHGVPQHNVLGRVSGEDFAAFHALVCTAATVARAAYDAADAGASAALWQQLFGSRFPLPPEPKSGGFTARSGASNPGGSRFA
jgi:hypothetical protein